MSNIFEYRKNLKPYEYPQLYSYVDSIRHSYWIHTEYNFTSDIQDYKINITSAEQEALKRAMLAIAQIEVGVKTFWGNLYNTIPKPEVGSVGSTFADSEVRHADAYAHLLEILGFNKEFENIEQIPCIIGRVDYMQEFINNNKLKTNKDHVKAISLFSLFIEHVSLFSQFLIIMSFNKHKNLFKGISNVIEATSKEEQIHGMFGAELINIIKTENPEWFDEDMTNIIETSCNKALNAELKILDWIFEKGELDFISKEEVINFIKDRFNKSLKLIGYTPLFNINEELLDSTEWFNDELMSTKHGDFFVKRSVNYNKKHQSITEDDLF